MKYRHQISIAAAFSLFAQFTFASVSVDAGGSVSKPSAADEKYRKAGTALKHYLHAANKNNLKASSVADKLPYTRVHDGKILLDITTYGNAQQILDELTALGLTNGAFFYKQISGMMPMDKIDLVLAHPGVRFATASQFKTRVGEATTQGDTSMGTDVARAAFGVDGSGIKVGTISDSFDALGGAAADVASGDLPDVTVLKDTMGTDEGRAMVQIVHDIAPGAKLYFRSGAFGEADFAAGIKEMAYLGIDIINDDIIYFSEPMFQDGIAAQAATYAIDIGTHYFSAAGNNDELSYEAPFRDSGLPPPTPVSGTSLSGIAHDFDPSPAVDILQRFVLEPDDNLTITFQWPQPFVSACEGDCPGPNTDYDLGLFDPATSTFVAVAMDDNLTSGAPLEILSYVNTGLVNQNLDLVIVKRVGPATDLIKYVEVSGISPSEYDVKSPTLFGHANGDKVIAVAAAAWFNVPPEEPVPFVNNSSATGGVPIYFDIHNQLLPEPLIRQNPDVTGPDAGNNTFFGNDSAQDPDTLPNFSGTSAATPHVAGLAALILDNASGKISPAEMETILETTALDIPDPAVGFDFKSGFGLVQAAGPDGAVCADLDHDDKCIDQDECVDVASKTDAGRCGCDVPEGTCKIRSSPGGGGSGGGFFLGVNPAGAFVYPPLGGPGLDEIIPPNTLPPANVETPKPENDTPSSSEFAPSSTVALEPAVARDDELTKESSSCSSVDNPSNGLLFSVLFTMLISRRARRRR